MADKPKMLKPGDPCPNCGGKIVEVPNADVKDNSALYRCQGCGYNARFPVKAT